MNALDLLDPFIENGTLTIAKGSAISLNAITLTAIEIDSRKSSVNSLFCALDGRTVLGIDYADQAYANGARILLCHTNQIPQNSVYDVILTTLDVARITGEIAAAFYQPSPDNLVAVTGTNGKTSVASFYAQIAYFNGVKSGQLGTMGLIATDMPPKDTLTSPDSITLHKLLHELKSNDINYVSLEASSHGLDQKRLAGVSLKAVGFTNLTQDHLDYHGTIEAYFEAKSRLFIDHLESDTTIILNCMTEWGGKIDSLTAHHTGPKIRIGVDEDFEIVILSREIREFGQFVKVKLFGTRHDFLLPLVGAFQVENILVAFGLALGAGLPFDKSLEALPLLKGPEGRLEYIGHTKDNVAIIIDYAHTPDAIEKSLLALREITKGQLHILFGAGGNRDISKRKQMGIVAQKYANKVWITDDNPRDEDPSKIREMILEGASKGQSIAGRAKAISYVITQATKNDVILIAGKGHEKYQEIAGVKYPFSDHEHVAPFLK